MAKQPPPPHSEECERAVLGGLLLQPELLAGVSARLRPEDLFLEPNRLLYQALLELREARLPIDALTLQDLLGKRGELEQVGGLSYITGLDLDLPDIGRLDTYVEIVKERSVRRRLIWLSQQVTRNCLEGGMDAQAAIKLVTESLRGLGQESAPPGGLQHVSGVVDRVADLIENPERARELLRGIPTGFFQWDRLGPGLGPGRVIVLAGRPGMGKTSFGLDVARHIALREGRRVAVVSLEMTSEQLVLRLLCAEAEVPLQRVRTGWLSQSDLGRLTAAASKLYAAPLWVDDNPDGDFGRIAAGLRRFRAEEGDLAAVVLDYLQLMHAPRRYSNRREEVTWLSRSTKTLAGELKTAAVVLSQLSRETTRRSDFRPRLEDLLESGAIEADADMVGFVHRPEYYEPLKEELKGKALLIVAKYRDGQTGDVPLLWSGPLMTFKPEPPPSAGPDPFS